MGRFWRLPSGRTLDLNADLGEGFDFDAALLPLLTSCSIACGGHSGDRTTIRSTLELARTEDVLVGAHPSYPDRENFGRRVLPLSRTALRESLRRQIDDFFEVCAEAGMPVHHIKLHGALYHQASTDGATAETVLEALQGLPCRPALYLPENSVLGALASGDFPVRWEAFLDRRYRADGSLVPRTQGGSLLSDPNACVEQLTGILRDRSIRTIEGATLPCNASTFCVHGDTPGAQEILVHVHRLLHRLGMRLETGSPLPPLPS